MREGGIAFQRYVRKVIDERQILAVRVRDTKLWE